MDIFGNHYQQKERLVKCMVCKDEKVIHEIPNPKCPKCNSDMITVLSSTMTGERITK